MSEQAHELDLCVTQNSQTANPTTHYNTPKQALAEFVTEARICGDVPTTSKRWPPEASVRFTTMRENILRGCNALQQQRAIGRGILDALSEARPSFASARWRRTSDRYRFDDWLLDPGLAGKPVVIGPTVRTKSIAEKHDASQESLTIGFNAGRNRAAGLRTLDHDHAHTSLPETRICRVKGPAGWSALSSVRGDLGGIAPGVVVRAKGSLLVTTLLQPAGFLLGEFLGYCGLSPQN
ncbi:hypothetical protein HZZ13_10605 [Bradyrhizobium sp. CNPSo 4010]|uniref:Uncharacterized protein n=1 Tax=Bradyrhizobium agreste TaxID=2751811 RepID=A0ABS0PN21_9BRAD|nr:hypothetical protein [Bradyrhizobium agreste]